MTDLRKAAEMMAYEVPLHELLEGVPENARLVIDSEDGMSTSFIPVGLYCKRAASALRQALAQPEQEPVAWFQVEKDADGSNRYIQISETDPEFYVPLYTAPPKREWVGLTDEEIEELAKWADKHAAPWHLEFAKAIEAKLKEKNT